MNKSSIPNIQTVTQRLRDYEVGDHRKYVEALVAKWREHHPECAAEVPSYLHPLVRDLDYQKRFDYQPDQMWFNDVYQVTLRIHKKDPVFDSKGGMIQLGISAFSGAARHDFRDLQAIKNQLAGAECEAFELYPAESRLLDPSNLYFLFCFPSMNRIRVGTPDRRVMDADCALAPQRAFGESPIDTQIVEWFIAESGITRERIIEEMKGGEIAPAAACISTFPTPRDRGALIKLIGRYQEMLEATIMGACLPGTNDVFDEIDKEPIARDRQRWREAEDLLIRITGGKAVHNPAVTRPYPRTGPCFVECRGDGNQMSALIGPNLAEGVAGFGDDLPDALRDLADALEREVGQAPISDTRSAATKRSSDAGPER